MIRGWEDFWYLKNIEMNRENGIRTGLHLEISKVSEINDRVG